MKNTESENIEIQLLLEAIYLKYGYDFRKYARASIKRRLFHRLSTSGLKSISEMQHKLLHDTSFFETILSAFSINVTEMFRDPSFYLALRRDVLPVLKTYPFLKIWNAGCSSGEEVYSMAILLQEEAIYNRAQIYATDFNEVILDKAKEGIFPLDCMRKYSANYLKAGGKKSLSDYYTARYDSTIMEKSLKANVVFADHNLATDGVFGEMNLILCRNVLIYFDKDLQNRVFKLFRDSLRHGGFLCLGSKESIIFSECADDFENVLKGEVIYRKKT
jgi:chemotaxis protein methyltransferase CheR